MFFCSFKFFLFPVRSKNRSCRRIVCRPTVLLEGFSSRLKLWLLASRRLFFAEAPKLLCCSASREEPLSEPVSVPALFLLPASLLLPQPLVGKPPPEPQGTPQHSCLKMRAKRKCWEHEEDGGEEAEVALTAPHGGSLEGGG